MEVYYGGLFWTKIDPFQSHRVFALQSSFCNRVYSVVEFLQSNLLRRRVFANRVSAFEFTPSSSFCKSSFCIRVYFVMLASLLRRRVYVVDFVVEFMQSARRSSFRGTGMRVRIMYM